MHDVKFKLDSTQEIELKKEVFKEMYLILAVLSGINLKIPFVQPHDSLEQGPTVRKFNSLVKGYFLTEFEGLREKLIVFMEDLATFLFHSKLIIDTSIVELF